MPRTRCSVPTCLITNYYSQEHKFYCFPREPNRQKLWMQMIGRVDINWERDVSKNYSVCDVHFHPLMIEKGRLKKYALPVLHLPVDNTFITSKRSVETQTYDLITVALNKPTGCEHTLDAVNTEENVGTKTCRKRVLILHTESEGEATKKPRQDIDNVIIDHDNIDKFGEHIVFLLKRNPRQLSRELQTGILTLINTVTKIYENETKGDAIPSTSSTTKVIGILSQIVLTPTLLAKPNTNLLTITTDDKSVEEESTQGKQLEERPGSSTDSASSEVETSHQPMTVPIELVGSLDCVKQETLDPGESTDVTGQEECNEESNSEIIFADPFKIEIEETDLVEEANRRENLNYDP